MYPLSFAAGQLLSQYQAQLGQWQSADRLYRIHTKLGPDALLVERVDGLEQFIGAPLPTVGLPLPDADRFPPGATVAEQAAQPQIQLGHMPLAGTRVC